MARYTCYNGMARQANPTTGTAMLTNRKVSFFRFHPGSRTIHMGSRIYHLPASRTGRIFAGLGLILLGFLGFLPVLGFWMIPLGLFVLSHDLAFMRRWRRSISVWWSRRFLRRKA